MDDIGALRLQRGDQSGEVAAVELSVTVDMHDHLGACGEAGTVGGEGRGAVSAVEGLHLDGHVGDIVEHGGGGVRRTVVGDVEGDGLGQRADRSADLVDEPSDALRLVEGGHDDGEMAESHGILGVAGRRGNCK